MADQKVSDLPSLNGVDVDAADLLYIVDSSAGTAGSKKITVGQYQLAPYSAGTANGVMYLNGSNVVTTGSGLVFDGSNLGIGAIPPGNPLDVTKTGIQIGATTAYSVARFRDATPNKGVSLGYDSGSQTGIVLAQTASASSNLAFWTFESGGSGWAERMRLDSSGNLLVGTTSANAKFEVVGVNGQVGIRATVSNSGDINAQLITNQTSGSAIQFYTSGTTSAGSISVSGSSTAYNTTSDRRLKDNIAPAPSASDVIDAIQIVSHDWKAAPDEHVTYGVIAQDLHAVAPQAVLQGDDGEEVEKTWGVDYSKLVPMLIKEIQALRARVAALEAQ